MKTAMRKALMAAAAALALAGPGLAQAPEPPAAPPAPAATPEAQAHGETLFNDNCAACHQRTGVGVKGAFPPLAGSPFVAGPSDELAATVLVGRGGMPAYASELTDDQLAQVLTYLRAAWGNKAAAVTAEDIAAARTKTGAVAQPKDLQAH